MYHSALADDEGLQSLRHQHYGYREISKIIDMRYPDTRLYMQVCMSNRRAVCLRSSYPWSATLIEFHQMFVLQSGYGTVDL